jgi:hypothetical protein
MTQQKYSKDKKGLRGKKKPPFKIMGYKKKNNKMKR